MKISKHTQMNTVEIKGTRIMLSKITMYKKETTYYGPERQENLIEADILVWVGGNEPVRFSYSSVRKRDNDYYILSNAVEGLNR